MKKLGILFGICMAICFSFTTTTANAKMHVPNVIQYDNMEGTDIGVDIKPSEDDESSEVSPFIKNAILSLDENISAKELNKNYIQYFTNSTNTVMTKGYGLFSIGMTIFNVLTNFLETIMSSFTLIAMLLYNVASSSFLSTVVNDVMGAIEKLIFHWNDPNAWMYKLLALFALTMIFKQITARFTKIQSFKDILEIFIKTIVTCMIVFAIGRYGRPVMLHMEGLLSSALTDSFSIGDSTEPIEIQNKELLFEVLQMQPFRIRHFGVADASQIPPSEGISNEDRVMNLLKNPSTSNGKQEYNKYNNKQITHNDAQAMQVFVVSLFFAVHRILLCIIFGAVSFLLIFINACKYLLLSTAFFQLLFALLKPSNKAHWTWFANSLQWTIISSVTYILFNIFLTFMQQAIVKITSINSILLIVFDLLILVIGWALIKYLVPKLIEHFRETGGDKYIEGIKGVLSGKISPKEMIENVREKKEDTESSSSNDKERGKEEKKTSIVPDENYENLSEESDDFKDEKEENKESEESEKTNKELENVESDTKIHAEDAEEDEIENKDEKERKEEKEEQEGKEKEGIDTSEEVDDESLGDEDEQLQEELEEQEKPLPNKNSEEYHDNLSDNIQDEKEEEMTFENTIQHDDKKEKSLEEDLSEPYDEMD